MGPEVERTPPVRRPARREARGLGAGAAAIGKMKLAGCGQEGTVTREKD